MSKHRIAVVVTVLGIVLAASSLAALYFTGALDRESNGGPTQSGFVTPLSPPVRGGPFSLVDHTARPVTDRDFRGRFMLVFFGYTYCPDICPTELQAMAAALDLLGEAGKNVQPIFISVDPERDTPEVLADYVAAFHPRLVGLTGTAEQIAAAAKVYHAGYMKVPLPSDVADKGSDEDGSADYGMAHSVTTYLVGPDGRVLATYPRGVWPKHMAADIRPYLEGRP